MDTISPVRRSENMRRIRSADMKPEMTVRRLVHALGYRYRLHVKNLPGKPDLVFTRRRKVIFVHGCFWHQQPGCREGRPPGSNASYWGPKLLRNMERDAAALTALGAAGWRALVIWECEVDAPVLAARLRDFLGEPAT